MQNVSLSRQRLAVFFSALAAICILAPTLSSQGRGRDVTIIRGREAVDGEVLVKFAEPQSQAERLQFDAQLDAAESEPLGLNLKRIRSRSYSAASLLAYLATRDDIVYAEPNYVIRAIAQSNDPFFSNLWGLLNTGQTIGGSAGVGDADIDATDAWDTTTGSTTSVVAVIDTGIDYNHPDLASNVWTAPSDFSVVIGGTKIDCAAGTHGFNAIAKTCNPLDDHGHGTHVSGTIGALGNNTTGVVGVNWTTRIIGVKFLSASGSGTTADAINAIEFMIQVKNLFSVAANVRVLSNSWGGGGFSQALLDKINDANNANMLFVAAAGNNGSNNDNVAFYPADYNAANLIAVAATTNTDHLASFSNYGPTRVHLAAPGVNILSTTPNNSYSYFSGTSMATPHVSGAAALVLSVCGSLDTAALKSTIISNVDAVAALNGQVSSNGRLNVNKAIQACLGTPPPPPPSGEPPSAPTITSATGGPGKKQITIKWTTASGAASYTVKVLPPGAGSYSVDASGITGTTYTDGGLRSGSTYSYIVTAVNSAGSTDSTPVGGIAR